MVEIKYICKNDETYKGPKLLGRIEAAEAKNGTEVVYLESIPDAWTLLTYMKAGYTFVSQKPTSRDIANVTVNVNWGGPPCKAFTDLRVDAAKWVPMVLGKFNPEFDSSKDYAQSLKTSGFIDALTKAQRGKLNRCINKKQLDLREELSSVFADGGTKNIRMAKVLQAGTEPETGQEASQLLVHEGPFNVIGNEVTDKAGKKVLNITEDLTRDGEDVCLFEVTPDEWKKAILDAKRIYVSKPSENKAAAAICVVQSVVPQPTQR